MAKYKITKQTRAALKNRPKKGATAKRPFKIPMARLPRAVKPEMKRNDSVIENQNMLALGNGHIQTYLTRTQGGVLESERIGNQITLRGIHIKGHLFNKTGNPAFMVRMMVINDKENNISIATGQELLVKANQNINYDQGTESAYLSVNKARYSVYLDKTYKLAATNHNGENIRMFNHFIKFNKTIKYGGSGLGSQKGNQLQFFVWVINPSGAVVTSEKVTLNSQFTTYFNDV